MSRSLYRIMIGCTAVLAGLISVSTTLILGVAGASAQTCVPAPNLLMSEVARVAGTGSGVWADTQQVQQIDAAQGTDASGKVLQDMLDVVIRDGYHFDCTTSRLTAVPGAAHPASPVTAATTIPPPGASGADATSQPGSPSATSPTGSSPNGDTAPPSANTGSTLPPQAAISTPNGRSGTHVPVALLLVLVLGSVALVVVAVRWQFSRR